MGRGSCPTEGAANDLHAAGAVTTAGASENRTHTTTPSASTPSGRAPKYPIMPERTAGTFTATMTPEMANMTSGVIATTPMNLI